MARYLEHRDGTRESQAAPHAARAGSARDLAARFDRQMRFAPLGREGQANLASSRVLVVGCGALGGVLAQTLFRAGVGELVLVDRDVVDLSNLPRQVLFDERQAEYGTPKALAARETLEASGGPTRIREHVAHLDARNIELLSEDCDLVLDGTDNLETRYLLNDFCVERGLAWIYSGVVGASGLVLPVLPGRSACLRCLFPDPPLEGVLPTCDSAGVLLPAVGAVASLAAGFALRLLARPHEAFPGGLLEIDVWQGSARRLSAQRDPGCPACSRREFPFLHRPGGTALALCGRNSVQVPARGERPDLARLARQLPREASGVLVSAAFLRFSLEGCRVTVFPDGRVLIEGTSDIERATALQRRALGGA